MAARVWSVALVSLVAAAMVGRPAAPQPLGAVGVRQADPGPSAATSEEALLILTDPAPPPAEVATVAVTVRGQAGRGIDEVEVILVEGHRAMARQVVEPTPGGRFGAVFTLPAPRREARLTVIAIARGGSHGAYAVVRRAVAIGSLDPGDTTR